MFTFTICPSACTTNCAMQVVIAPTIGIIGGGGGFTAHRVFVSIVYEVPIVPLLPGMNEGSMMLVGHQSGVVKGRRVNPIGGGGCRDRVWRGGAAAARYTSVVGGVESV